MARTRRNTTPRKAASARRKAPQASWRIAADTALRNASSCIGQAAELRQVGRRLAADALRSARESASRRGAETRARAATFLAGIEKALAEGAYRVASRFGVPTARDVRSLSRQVASLRESVEQLRRPRARA